VPVLASARTPVQATPMEPCPSTIDWNAHLEALAAEHAPSYRDADPFAHAVIDDFLPPAMLAAAIAGFPSAVDPIWQVFRTGAENLKGQSRDLARVDGALRAILEAANGAPFLGFLERLTGIAGLLGDDGYSGGGLHQTRRGGHLSLHVDYNYHPVTRWDRRLNALLYLNPDWDDDWGGHLELWDADVTRCARRIAPIANRLVVFSTGETSWHGHPSPLAAPADIVRRSIATYYYSIGRPEEERAPDHNTVFRARPGEVLRRTPRERAGAAARALGISRARLRGLLPGG